MINNFKVLSGKVKLPFIIFKMFNVLAIILSLGLFLVNIKFIVNHMLKHIKTGGNDG
jgi:hypothetical protein